MNASERSLHLTRIAAKAAYDRMATHVVAFDVSQQLAITDVFLIATANSDRQVSAVVDAVEEALRAEDAKRVRIEGDRDNRWVLVDFLDLVVHVMQPDERAEYALERLWGDCPRIELGLDGEDDPERTGAEPAAPAPPEADRPVESEDRSALADQVVDEESE